MSWLPPQFIRLVESTHRGEAPTVAVPELLRWFNFSRRGARVNAHLRGVMRAAGVTSTPTIDHAFHDSVLHFQVDGPPRAQQPPLPPRAEVYPVAVFDAIVSGQTEVVLRVRSQLDAVERLVAYLTFALIAIGRRDEGTLREAIRPALPEGSTVGPPVSFGTWVELSRRLSREGEDPIAAAARVVFSAGSHGASLARVVEARNKFTHGSNLPESEWRSCEPLLVDVSARLRESLAPLLDADLACVRATAVGEREAYRYTLRVLRGGGPYFPARDIETAHKLTPRWAYLLRDAASPLRLAPGVFCQEDASTGAVQVFFARVIALDPEAPVKLRAVVGADDRTENLPR